RGLARLEQTLGVLRDLADRKREGRVADEAVERHADVDRADVAGPQRVRAGDAVDEHRVRRRADRRGVPAVALERRDAAARADVLFRELVELLRRHARHDALAEQLERFGDDLRRALHLLDLGCALADDHATAACSSASWISAKTASTVRSPCTVATFERA